MTIGAYELIAPDGRRYVGGSGRSIENRLGYHKARLAKGAHYNRALQEVHDECGWGNIRICVTAAENYLLAEQRKMDYWRARGKLLNVHPLAKSSLGSKRSYASKRRSAVSAKERCTPEWRAAVSERVKRQHAEGRFGYDPATIAPKPRWDRTKPHGLTGKKKSEEHRLAARKARWGY